MGSLITDLITIQPEDRFLNSKKEFFRGISPFHTRQYDRNESIYKFSAPATTVQLHGAGLGDLMIMRQFGRGFEHYLAEHGDPELGKVVIATGGYIHAIDPNPGDINCYWWWSFGTMDDHPDEYLETYADATGVDPDVILCLSEQCQNEAQRLGFNTLYLPLATAAFSPLGLDRSGLGYAGSKRHKADHKMDRLLGPVWNNLEWVSGLRFPSQLNLWYNTKLATFGLHKEGQRFWGMVNNRVFETIASGTPLILESHPTVENVLGFDYPYQSSSREETVRLVEEIRSDPESVIAEFADYAETVLREHRYRHRVETLFDYLSDADL